MQDSTAKAMEAALSKENLTRVVAKGPGTASQLSLWPLNTDNQVAIVTIGKDEEIIGRSKNPKVLLSLS
jgi:hypothetical protein